MTIEDPIERAVRAQQSGRLAEAADLYGQLLDALPQSTPPSRRAEILNNLGAILERLERDDEAIDCFRRAVAVAPSEAIPAHNFGDALHRAGEQEEATGHLRTADLEEYVARDAQDYADLCVRMLESPDISERRRAFRTNARELLLGSAVCDAGSFARAMEGLYQELWTAPAPSDGC